MGECSGANFQRGLNQHGFAFQHRVIAEAARLHDARKCEWELLSIEQPVSAGDEHTRIDFILHCRQGSKAWFLVAECKRVNPAFGLWCFAKGAYHRPGWLGSQIILEVLALGKSPTSLAAGGPTSDQIFDIGFALKKDQPGDSHPIAVDKDAVEMTCSQIVRGLNGLIKGTASDSRMAASLEGVETVTFLPVVFTTAELYTSAVDLRSTSLNTGEVTLSDDARAADWIYFQYPQSPAVRHSIAPSKLQLNSMDSWPEVVARDYWRTIVMVSPYGIANFLERRPPGWL